MGEPSGLTEPENAALVLPVTVGTEGLTAGAAGTPAVIWPTTDKPATPLPVPGLNSRSSAPEARLNSYTFPVTRSAVQNEVPSGSRFRANNWGPASSDGT